MHGTTFLRARYVKALVTIFNAKVSEGDFDVDLANKIEKYLE